MEPRGPGGDPGGEKAESARCEGERYAISLSFSSLPISPSLPLPLSHTQPTLNYSLASILILGFLSLWQIP